jgi:hypothetical protein
MDNNKDLQQAKELNRQSATNAASQASPTGSIANQNNANNFELEQAKQENQKSAQKKKG